MRAIGLCASLLALGCAAPGGSSPQEPAPRAAPHAEEHGAGTQSLNAFAGGSQEVGDRDGGTFGVDYEYRLAPRWGVGGFAETIAGLERSFAVGAQAYWHAVDELVLVAGPGLERSHEDWSGILRVGGFYEFSLGDGWVLSPAIFYDFTEHDDILIYGLNLGYIW